MTIAPLLEKLNLLDTDKLLGIQEHIESVLALRLDIRPAPGRIATFEYGGVSREVRIVRVNQKTATCVEISPKAGHKWRVGLNFLKVNPIERNAKAAIAIAKPASYKPATVEAESW